VTSYTPPSLYPTYACNPYRPTPVTPTRRRHSTTPDCSTTALNRASLLKPHPSSPPLLWTHPATPPPLSGRSVPRTGARRPCCCPPTRPPRACPPQPHPAPRRRCITARPRRALAPHAAVTPPGRMRARGTAPRGPAPPPPSRPRVGPDSARRRSHASRVVSDTDRHSKSDTVSDKTIVGCPTIVG
jgi:hypothetical protein